MLRYLYNDRTMGYSELVRAAREIESDLEENKSDMIKSKVTLFESNTEESAIELLMKQPGGSKTI